MFISWFFLFFSVLIIVPFITLLERKVLSYIQNRKGPNKVGLLGVVQPVLDGLKLIFKEVVVPFNSNLFVYIASAFFSFILMLFSWSLVPSFFPFFIILYSFVFFLVFSSFNVYTLLGSGWGSNSKYSLLGSIRGSCQVVSYEVNLLFLVVFPCFCSSGYNFFNFMFSFSGFYFFFFLIFIWVILIFLETNRSPFDFAEGESELVSGFNTEYSSLVFAFLFLGEYGSILFLSFLTSLIFFNCFFFFFITLFFSFLFLWVRGSYPRYRYDLLMSFCWKFILPSLVSFFFVILFFL